MLERHRKDVIHQAEKRIEGGLNRVGSPNRRITVKDLLKRLGVRDQLLSPRDAGTHEALRRSFVRMGHSHQVHGDVRINEDHSDSLLYPRSISESMMSISAV